MKGPIGFGKVVNIVMNVILGLCMSLVMLTAAGVPLLPEIVVEAWFASFCIGYAFGDIVPVASWGPALCAKDVYKRQKWVYVNGGLTAGWGEYPL